MKQYYINILHRNTFKLNKEWRETWEWDNCFYIGSLNHIATSNLPRQHEPNFHYYQKFYKSQTKITLLNNKKNQDFWLTHKSQSQLCKTHTYRPEITLGTQAEAQELVNLKVALPIQPNLSFLSFYQAKKPSRSTKIFNLHLTTVWFREREFSSDELQVFTLKN